MRNVTALLVLAAAVYYPPFSLKNWLVLLAFFCLFYHHLLGPSSCSIPDTPSIQVGWSGFLLSWVSGSFYFETMSSI